MSVAFLPYVDVLSVELGILMARLDARPEKWGGTYHAKNEAMILRIAAAGGYRADIEASGDPAWLFIDFDRRT